MIVGQSACFFVPGHPGTLGMDGWREEEGRKACGTCGGSVKALSLFHHGCLLNRATVLHRIEIADSNCDHESCDIAASGVVEYGLECTTLLCG